MQNNTTEEASVIDVNTPVTNPDLVAAMQRLKVDDGEETTNALLLALNQANFLVVVFTDEMNTTKSDEDGVVVVNEGSLIKVLTTTDSNGDMYLPLFTDWEAIGKRMDKPVNAFVFSSQDAWHWALNMGEYQGIVINPAEDALPLNKELVEFLASTQTTK